MQTVLDEEDVRADNADSEDGDDEWAELFAKPVAENVPSTGTGTGTGAPRESQRRDQQSEVQRASGPTTETVLSTPTPTQAAAPSSTLRSRHAANDVSAQPTALASGRAGGSGSGNEKLQDSEQALSNHRLEQEDLTGSLLSLASQLKASSQSFQSSLESEQSVLDRAVNGIDRTSSTMEAAGQRMGMLRRMTEGKGWWGRMMLYAWIVGLWVVAILLVFVGPKLRF